MSYELKVKSRRYMTAIRIACPDCPSNFRCQSGYRACDPHTEEDLTRITDSIDRKVAKCLDLDWMNEPVEKDLSVKRDDPYEVEWLGYHD